MKLLTVRIKPLEPLMLRGSGEYDPSSRGVFSHAQSLLFPRPSTIIGMLISTFMSLGHTNLKCININSWSDLLDCYSSTFDVLGIKTIRGSYLYNPKENEVYVPLRLDKRVLLVNYRQLIHCLLAHPDYGNVLDKLFLDPYNEELLYALKDVSRVLEEKYSLEVEEHWRVGIGLKVRKERGYTKTTEEGYIYTARYIAYLKDIEIRFKIIVRNKEAKVRSLIGKTLLVKFGGEHRAVRMTIDDEVSDIIDDVLNMTTFNYALLLSPMPLYNRVYLGYIGEYDIIGLGFSIARKRRKPLYPAILEGSVMRVEARQGISKHELLHSGLYYALDLNSNYEYRVLGRIGYASYVPLTLD